MTPKRQRLMIVLLCAVAVCGGVGLILYSFSQHIIYFYTPTQVQSAKPEPIQEVRIGGMVEVGSIKKLSNDTIRFTITDLTHSIRATYAGHVPALFREGQGVVAQGTVVDGVLKVQTLLAKHDENYMPKEVVDSLKASGRWQHYSEENKKTYAP